MRKLGVIFLAIIFIFMLAGCAEMLISDEFREIREQEQTSIEEIWNIEDKNDFVYEMSDYIVEKCDYGSNLNALSEAERVLYITQTLEMEVNNGGFWQFFFNTPENVFRETAAALEAIGAEKTSSLYCEAAAAFGEEMPSSRTSRMRMLGKFGMEEGYEILAPYDDAFFASGEDLNALNYAFIQNNRDAFS